MIQLFVSPLVFMFCLWGFSTQALPSALPTSTGDKVLEEYYFGLVSHFSVDGTRLYNQSYALIRQQVDPGAGEIRAWVLKISDELLSEGLQEHQEYFLRLKRQPDTAVFVVTDQEMVDFTGAIIFTQGEDWAWTHWDYDLTLDNGGLLRGFAELSEESLVVSKVVMSAGGHPLFRIEERLGAISQDDYLHIYQVLTGHNLGIQEVD